MGLRETLNPEPCNSNLEEQPRKCSLWETLPRPGKVCARLGLRLLKPEVWGLGFRVEG